MRDDLGGRCGAGRVFGAARRLACGLTALAVCVSAPVAGVAAWGVALGAFGGSAWAQQAETSTPDLVVFHDGRSVEGEILEETATHIRMRVVFRGIVSETRYPKGDIASIKRGVKSEPSPQRAETRRAETPDVGRAPARAPEPISEAGGARVYLLELTGWFGKDITQTPIREAVKDAERMGADYLIVSIENTWRAPGAIEDRSDDDAAFDELWEAEEIAPIFFSEIPQEWDNPPKVIFWVKRAMGGAAFLPLVGREIYFAEDGKMGGIGNLGELFTSGDEVVKEKQFSLRLASARGLAERGGHDTRLVEAMARKEYQLWARFRGGEVIFIDNPALVEEGDMLLTDDGEGENADTDEQIVREQGNDVLTLNADLAFNLGLSKGTVNTLDDLFFELGIERQARVLEGKSEDIMRKWRRSVKGAEDQLEELWEEFNETQVAGDQRERGRARGVRIRKAEEMIRILRRFEEAINPGQIGVPGIADLEITIERIRLDQLADRDQ